MIKHFLAITCLTLSIGANAALVDNITYVTDTVTGMDYLKLSQTHDQFWHDVVTNDSLGFISQGWSVTSQESLAALTDAYGNLAVHMIRDNSTVPKFTVTNNDLLGGQQMWLDQFSVIVDYLVGVYHHPGAIDMCGWPPCAYQHGPYSQYSVSFSRPSVVPIPAAGWLFMSALIGLIGKKRLSRR